MACVKRSRLIPAKIFPKRYDYTQASNTLTERLEKLFTLNKLFTFLDHFFSVVMKINLKEIYICNQADEKSMVYWDLIHEKTDQSKLMNQSTKLALKEERKRVVYNTGDPLYEIVFNEHPSDAAILCYENDLLIGILFVDLPEGLNQYVYDDNRLFDKIARQVGPVLFRALAHNRVLTHLDESQKNASLIKLVNEYNHEIKGAFEHTAFLCHPSRTGQRKSI